MLNFLYAVKDQYLMITDVMFLFVVMKCMITKNFSV